MRRFWDVAAPGSAKDGFAVLLDGKPVHLPGGTVLHVPGHALAAALAAEWQRAGATKGGEMSFADVPLTRLAGTAQERVGPDPAATIEAIARYGESDLLCYRAEGPATLAERQARLWQPWLDWAACALEAPLRVGHGVTHVAQPPEALRALRGAVAAHDALGLAALGVLVPALGSLVLGLAIDAGRLTAADAIPVAMLDELYQAELWGDDRDAADRRAQIAAEITLAANFIELARLP
jgi:chaperone required for assembly of F1-ATPase